MKLCKPLRSPLQAALMIVFTASLTLLTAALSVVFPALAAYLRLAGVCFFAFGFCLAFRYSMTEYIYVLCDGSLTVRRVIGVRDEAVFSLRLEDALELCDRRGLKRHKLRPSARCRQNLSARCAYIVFVSEKKKRCLEFEPNREFYDLVKEAIEESKKGGDAPPTGAQPAM